jgi:hypothetical protein
MAKLLVAMRVARQARDAPGPDRFDGARPPVEASAIARLRRA